MDEMLTLAWLRRLRTALECCLQASVTVRKEAGRFRPQTFNPVCDVDEVEVHWDAFDTCSRVLQIELSNNRTCPHKHSVESRAFFTCSRCALLKTKLVNVGTAWHSERNVYFLQGKKNRNLAPQCFPIARNPCQKRTGINSLSFYPQSLVTCASGYADADVEKQMNIGIGWQLDFWLLTWKLGQWR